MESHLFGVTEAWEQPAPDLEMDAVLIETPSGTSLVMTIYTATVDEGRVNVGDDVTVFYYENGVERSMETTVAVTKRYNDTRDKILLYSDVIALDTDFPVDD